MRTALAILAFAITGSALALEPAQIYAKAAPSIVGVLAFAKDESNGGRFGSGIVIAPGEVVTNCHVLDGMERFFVKRNEYYSRAFLRTRDDRLDLCRISAFNKEGFDQPVYAIAPAAQLRVGQKVYAIGAPQGLTLTLSDGLISSLRPSDIGVVIQTTAPISKGSSGGGLFDTEGRLVGVTSFQFVDGQNLNFAVPASWIAQPLEVVVRQSGGLSYLDRALSNAERPIRDHVELLKIIKAKLKKTPDRSVLVVADKDAPSGSVLTVIDFLRQNHVLVESPGLVPVDYDPFAESPAKRANEFTLSYDPFAEPDDESEVESAILNNPTLFYWRAYDAVRWNRAAEIDKILRTKPEYANTSFAIRFSRVVELVESELGPTKYIATDEPIDFESIKK